MSNFQNLSGDEQITHLHEMACIALRQWDGEFHDIALIKYRENAVFSAYRHDGQRIALRVHRHNYHCEAALRSELQWMEALGGEGVEVPSIIRARDDQHLVSVYTDAVGETRHVDMLVWLSGSTLGTSESGVSTSTEIAPLFFNAGAVAASIHNHSETWQQPDEFIRHAWDEEGLIGSQPFWGRFWDLQALTGEQRELLLLARRAARNDLRRYGRNRANYGMIHADFVPENLLVEGAKLRLIDFDDAGFGWHMFELATALYFSLEDPRYNEMEDALFAGYASVRPLSNADRALLPLFLTLRGMTYLGWVHTRAGSATALELTDFLIERTCMLARTYLNCQ